MVVNGWGMSNVSLMRRCVRRLGITDVRAPEKLLHLFEKSPASLVDATTSRYGLMAHNPGSVFAGHCYLEVGFQRLLSQPDLFQVLQRARQDSFTDPAAVQCVFQPLAALMQADIKQYGAYFTLHRRIVSAGETIDRARSPIDMEGALEALCQGPRKWTAALVDGVVDITIARDVHDAVTHAGLLYALCSEKRRSSGGRPDEPGPAIHLLGAGWMRHDGHGSLFFDGASAQFPTMPGSTSIVGEFQAEELRVADVAGLNAVQSRLEFMFPDLHVRQQFVRPWASV